jgi:hypothetical protein
MQLRSQISDNDKRAAVVQTDSDIKEIVSQGASNQASGLTTMAWGVFSGVVERFGGAALLTAAPAETIEDSPTRARAVLQHRLAK